MTDRADLPRDAWLTEALRHAPDLTDAPPPALTEAILREAAAKAATPRGAAPLGGMERLWHWIARPRVAAGFATLTVVTLVGLMWRDRPMDDVMPQAPVREAPAPTMTPRPAPAIAPPPASQPAAAKAEAAPKVIVAPAPTAKMQPPSVKAAPAPAPAPASPAAPPPATASAEQTTEAPAVADAARAPSPPPATAPAAGPLASRSLAAPSEAGMDRARRAVGRVDEDPPSTLAGLRAAIAAQPGRWTWQSGSAPPQPFTPAVSAWLQQAEAAVGGRRLAIAGNATTGRELRVWRDGRPLQSFRLTGGTLHWQRADEAAGGVAVELGEPAVRRLVDALDAAVR